MSRKLTEIETRILGCLIEKQLTTPEYYPLTLNALTAASNQKSNRDPVMSLDETPILAAIDELRDMNLVYLYYGSTSRTVKYKHMADKVYDLSPAGVSVLALLFLRGPQTVGEIRGRSDRLYEFSGLGEVQETLDELAQRDEPLVVKLPRQAGHKESRYAHTLSGEVHVEALAASAVSAPKAEASAALNERIEALENDFKTLRDEFAEFRKQFE